MGNHFKRMGKLNVVMGKLKAIGRNLSIKLKVGGKVNFRCRSKAAFSSRDEDARARPQQLSSNEAKPPTRQERQ